MTFTGTIRSEPFVDRHGRRYVQVFEYECGVCVDRYITRYIPHIHGQR